MRVMMKPDDRAAEGPRTMTAAGSVAGENERRLVEHAQVSPGEIREALFTSCPTIRSLSIKGVQERGYIYGPPDGDMLWSEHAERLREAFGHLPPGRITTLEADVGVYEDGDWASHGCERFFGDSFVRLVAEAPALAGLRVLRLPRAQLGPGSIPWLARLTKLEVLATSDDVLGDRGRAELHRVHPALRLISSES